MSWLQWWRGLPGGLPAGSHSDQHRRIPTEFGMCSADRGKLSTAYPQASILSRQSQRSCWDTGSCHGRCASNPDSVPHAHHRGGTFGCPSVSCRTSAPKEPSTPLPATGDHLRLSLAGCTHHRPHLADLPGHRHCGLQCRWN